MSDARHEFTATEIIDLLSELDKRLKTRGISAAVFVVGGAAIAVTSNDSPRRTEDIDAITRDRAVLEEARAMAKDRKLPEDWLNTHGRPWMPPLPEGVLQHDDAPGCTSPMQATNSCSPPNWSPSDVRTRVTSPFSPSDSTCRTRLLPISVN